MKNQKTVIASARSASRAKEVGLRKINGAGRSEIIAQFLDESMRAAMANPVDSLRHE